MSLDALIPLSSAASLVCCVYFWRVLKKEIRLLQAQHDRRLMSLETALRKITLEFQAIQQAWSQVDKKVESLPEVSLPRPGMNLSRREVVLRMYRRGERPEQIAAALRLPQNEVDLLLKVHQVVGAG